MKDVKNDMEVVVFFEDTQATRYKSYLSPSFLYSKQFLSTPSLQGSVSDKMQTESSKAPYTIGAGMNARIRVMICCTPRAKEP
jgi:hypothetical protein